MLRAGRRGAGAATPAAACQEQLPAAQLQVPQSACTCALIPAQSPTLTGCCSGVISRRSAPSLLIVTSLFEKEEGAACILREVGAACDSEHTAAFGAKAGLPLCRSVPPKAEQNRMLHSATGARGQQQQHTESRRLTSKAEQKRDATSCSRSQKAEGNSSSAPDHAARRAVPRHGQRQRCRHQVLCLLPRHALPARSGVERAQQSSPAASHATAQQQLQALQDRHKLGASRNCCCCCSLVLRIQEAPQEGAARAVCRPRLPHNRAADRAAIHLPTQSKSTLVSADAVVGAKGMDSCQQQHSRSRDGKQRSGCAQAVHAAAGEQQQPVLHSSRHSSRWQRVGSDHSSRCCTAASRAQQSTSSR